VIRTIVLALASIVSSATGSFGQALGPKLPMIHHVTVAPTSCAASVAPGGTVTLSVDVTPRTGAHVYAFGAKDFTPVSLVMTPRAGVTMAKAKYPPSELQPTLGVAEPVPVYRKTFRVTQPVTIAASIERGETLTLGGALNYQACDDKVCYPAAAIPVLWRLTVR
jgi:hypothetical protein